MAKARHVSFGDDGRSVTWLLPSSKTDPRAVGTTQGRDCICGVARVSPACPVCARRRGLERARVIGGYNDVPPEPLADDLGCQSFGGHSLRTGGASGLASLGANPFKIQTLGRWRSSLVLHYAGDALHRGVATDLIEASRPTGSVDALAAALGRMDARLDAMAATINAAAPPAFANSGMYIANVRTACWHWTSSSPAWDHGLQKTDGCGWAFMRLRFERAHQCPANTPWHRVCDRCLPELRAKLRREQEQVDLSDLD